MRLVPEDQREGAPAGETAMGLSATGCRGHRPDPLPAAATTASWVDDTTASGRRRADPAEERSVLGLVTSAVDPAQTTAVHPDASAERMTVPTFPGSATSLRITTQPDATAAGGHTSSSGTHSDPLTIAATGCGDDGVRTFSRTPLSTATRRHVERKARCRVGIGEDGLDIQTGPQRLGHQRRTLDHECALVPTRTTTPNEAP